MKLNFDEEVMDLRAHGYNSAFVQREIEQRQIPEQELRYAGITDGSSYKGIREDDVLSKYSDSQLIGIRDRLCAIEAEEMYTEYMKGEERI